MKLRHYEFLIEIISRWVWNVSLHNLEPNLWFQKIIFNSLFGGFNSKSNSWYITITTRHLLKSEIINEAILILEKSISCIELIWTFQIIIVAASGFHLLFFLNCLQQIVMQHLILMLITPSPYGSKLWHHQKTIVEEISMKISSFPR